MSSVKTENEDLNLHVNICAERYQGIKVAYEGLDTRMNKLETKLEELTVKIDNKFENLDRSLESILNKIDQEKTDNLRGYLGWSGAIILVLLGALGWTITKIIG